MSKSLTLKTSQKMTSRGDASRAMVSVRGGSPGGVHFPTDEASTEDHAGLANRLELLEQDLERRQESYLRRERAYNQRIQELEEEIANQKREKTGWMKSQDKVTKLKEMQGQILHRVELVQDRTAKILQEQERDLLRAFRARLFDVQTELEKEKSKKDDGAVAWIERSRRLEAEVEWAKEVSDRLNGVNHSLSQENTRLKTQFHGAKQEHTFTLEKLGVISSENGRLVAECAAIEAENKKLKQEQEIWNKIKDDVQLNAMSNVGGKGGGHKQLHESEERFREANLKLKKQLAEEKKALATSRQTYANELKARTEMELLLRQCVEDVRREIVRRNIEAVQFSSGADLTKLFSRAPGTLPTQEFMQEEHDRALELLLSQERVVTLLYRKTFPLTNKSKTKLLTPVDGNSTDHKGLSSLPLLGMAQTHSVEEEVASAREAGERQDKDAGKFPRLKP